METNKLLNTNEAAAMLRLAPVYIRQLCREGKIPFLRLKNGHYLFDKIELTKALIFQGEK